jgi:hypothetical protein
MPAPKTSGFRIVGDDEPVAVADIDCSWYGIENKSAAGDDGFVFALLLRLVFGIRH